MREIDAISPVPGELLVKAHCSALNSGAESLIFRGGMPEGWGDTDGEQSGDGIRYPFAYGAAMVGEVIDTGSRDDRDWLGKRVFVAHPHQPRAVVDRDECVLLPEAMPTERALFLASMDMALNLILEAAPQVGERGMVFGQGVIGVLTAGILGRFPLDELIAVDPIAERRERSLLEGAALAIDPARGRELAILEECLFHGDHEGLDFVIEVSGQLDALNQAIRLCGSDSRVVVGSWYGRQAGLVSLGGHFHRKRIRLISSQAGSLSPQLSGRWDKTRRLRLALDWLDRIAPERFITHRFALPFCQEAFELAADKNSGAFQVIFDY